MTRDAVRRLAGSADRSCSRTQPAELERHAIAAGELQIRDAARRGRRGRERPRGARRQRARQPREAGATPLPRPRRARRPLRRSASRRTRRTAPGARAAATCARGHAATGAWRATTAGAGGRRSASVRTLVRATVGRDGVNYLVTNHIPRRLATRFMGWFSRVEQPLVARLSLAIWRAAAGDALRLDEAERSRVSQHPRLLHPRPETRRAAHRPQRRHRREPLRRHRRRRRSHRRRARSSKPRASPTRSTICCRTPTSRRAVAMATTSRSGSPRRCTTASTRRMTAA